MQPLEKFSLEKKSGVPSTPTCWPSLYWSATGLSHFAGVDYVGPLPAEIQQFTIFPSGIIAGAKKRGMEPG